MIFWATLLPIFFQDRTKVKLELPNDAKVYCRNIESAKTFTMSLAIVSLKSPEQPETHGIRHLLEHLVAKGRSKDLDTQCEMNGMVLKAETTRDAMVFSLTGSPKNLELALRVVKDLIGDRNFEDSELSKEVQVIRQELALRPWTLPLVAELYKKSFGEGELDPFGNPDELQKLKGSDVTAAWNELRNPQAIACTITGPIEAEKTATQVAEILKGLSKRETTEIWWRLPGKGAVYSGSLDGEAVAISVAPFSEPETSATIGASLGLRSWAQVYGYVNLSPRNSAVSLCLGTGTTWSNLAAKLSGREALIAKSGQLQLAQWGQELLTDPARLSPLMATVLPFRPGFDPDSYCEGLRQVTRSQCEIAVRKFLNAGRIQ